VCGRSMFTLAGKTRRDGSVRRAYMCSGRASGQCAAPRVDARAVDHVLIASLNRFLGGLEETAPYRPSPGFPRELIRGQGDTSHELVQPIASITAELRERITHALQTGDRARADALIDELLAHRERLRASVASGPVRHSLNLAMTQDPRELLFDFYAWSANDLAGYLISKPEDTVRLNRVLRRWFQRILLRLTPQGIEIAPVLQPQAPGHSDDIAPNPVPAYAQPDQWRVALRIAGYGHRHGDRWGQAEIIHALRSWASAHGRAPHTQDWGLATPEHPNFHIVIKQFGRWNLGIAAAGLTPAPVRRHTYKLAGSYAPAPDTNTRPDDPVSEASDR
jgi:hypothetical protein